ncbi:hypothetical protein KQH82_09285 [bacterium]|nr:hypothetical protein [bacterium]
MKIGKVLLLVLPVLFMIGCSQTVEQKRDTLYAKGLAQLDEFRFQDADTTFREVLWTDTTSFLGPIGISLTLERQFFHWDALNFYMKIMERDTLPLEGALGAMRVYRRLGMWELALRRAALASNMDTVGGDVQAEFARLCLETKQYDAGRRTAEQAVRLGQPPAVSDMIAARAFYMEGKTDSASTRATHALENDPGTSLACRIAADYYEEKSVYDSAMAFSGRSLTAEGSGFDEMAEHFFRSLRLGYFSEARRLIDSVQAIGGVTSMSTVMDLYYSWATEQDIRGLGVSGGLARMQLPVLSPMMFDAWAHRQVSNFTMVDGDLKAISSMLGRGNFEQSFRDYMGYYLSLFRAEGHDPVGALHALRSNRDVRFSDLSYATTELFLVHVTRQPELFDQMLDSLRQLRRNDYKYRTAIADVCADSAVQEFDASSALYDEALTLNPYYRPAFDGYWKSLNRLRHFKRSLDVFDKYPQFAELYPDLGVKRAIMLVKNDQVDAAMAQFFESFEPVSGDARLAGEMIRWLFRKYAAADARKLADRLLEYQGDNLDALVLAAEVYNRAEDFEGALRLADRALAIDAGSVPARANRAWSLFKLGNDDEAFSLFEQIYEVDADNRTLLRYYAPALAESGRDNDNAENLARRGAFAGVDVLEGWLTLCYVYMLNGRPDLAKGEAIRARSGFPWSPVTHYYVGYSEYLLKQGGAKENLQRAIDMGLQGEDLERARAAIEELS